MACENCRPCGNRIVREGPLTPVAIVCDLTGGGGGGGTPSDPLYVQTVSGDLTPLNISKVDAIEQTLIAGQVGNRIVPVTGIVQNISMAQTDVIIRQGVTIIYDVTLDANAYLSWDFNGPYQWKLPEDIDLTIELSGANEHKVIIFYYRENI